MCNIQETLHKNNEDTIETVEESVARMDTDENGNGGCLRLP